MFLSGRSSSSNSSSPGQLRRSCLGAIAPQRVKFHAFIVFSFIMVGIIYPITGHWIWGGGWLAKLGMFDFAGSTVVHSVGGWAALAGAVISGATSRQIYAETDASIPIPGHNMSYGDGGGPHPVVRLVCRASTLAVPWRHPSLISPGIAVTTNTAAATAAFTATLAAWLMIGKPDLTMIINGALAGTGGDHCGLRLCQCRSGSVIIGAIAGVLVVASEVLFFDRMKVDDPVGACPVHLVNGIFGTTCKSGFFHKKRSRSIHDRKWAVLRRWNDTVSC